MFKGKLGHYHADKGVPKSGKIIVVDFKQRKVIGEAHTKKGVQKLLGLHSGDTKVMPLAYVPKRGRPRGPSKKTLARAANPEYRASLREKRGRTGMQVYKARLRRLGVSFENDSPFS